MIGVKLGGFAAMYAYAIPVLLGVLSGCASAAPCSKQSLAQLELECAAKIKMQCAKGDRTCPTYLDCKSKVEAWRVCGSQP